MADVDRVLRLTALTGAIAWSCLGLGCAAGQTAEPAAAVSSAAPDPGSESASAGTKGRIVPAPANLFRFSPPVTTVSVNATEVNLRQVFEDLGPDATLWYQHVQMLANPFLEGRLPGTRGAELAAEYIEFYFRHYGLEPAFPAPDAQSGGTVGTAWVGYRQPFAFSRRERTVEVAFAELSIENEPLVEGVDYVVLGNSGSGEVTAPVSFVGYGIEEGPDGYTSFDEDTDLSGRIALLIRYAPLDEAGHHPWPKETVRRHAAIARKMQSLTERNAAGVLIVNPPGAVEGQPGLESVESSVRFSRPLDIPVMQIEKEVASRLLRDADPIDRELMAWRRRADTREVGTVHLSDTFQVTAISDVERRRDRQEHDGENVGAVLRGRGDLADEWIVIGAHRDHVGHGSLGGINPRNRDQLHPGADDNASGTAGVLILAKKLSEAYAATTADASLRSILFLTFDAEEMGLHGSRHYTDDPTISPDSINMMLNMDMIGRLRSRNLSVLGTGTAEGLAEVLRPLFEDSGLTISINPGGSGRSDEANFHRLDVPGLHFFTGMHREYTSPRDEAYTVNPAGAEEILELMSEIALTIAARPQRLVYQDAPTGRGRDRGYAPVRLGIRPGMGEEVETGVLVDDVFEGTSAAEGGMKAGDIITAWDDTVIEGMRDLFNQLQQHKPGDRVKITVLRDGQPIGLDVTLTGGRQ
ncbi:MAG: M28 family peptidase [Planctomycetota bacterium]|jgi:hypothetical protein